MPTVARLRTLHGGLIAAILLVLFGGFTASTAQADTVTVYVLNFDFGTQAGAHMDPTIHVGDTVHWVWQGGYHSTTSVAGLTESWDSGLHQVGTPAFTYDHTFTHTGNFPYYCTIHAHDNGNQTAGGMMIGTVTVLPAPTATWAETGVSTGADGFTRVLWDKSDGMAAVWKVDASGNLTTQQQYGPYTGWTAKAVATGKDNQTRLLWTNTSGAAAYYLLDANNVFVSQQQYGPYTGWTAQGLAVEPDNTVRALWTNSSGMATVWSMDAANTLTSQAQFGPYPNAQSPTWTAKSLAVNPDGMERLLWNNADGTAAFWKLSPGSQLQSQQQYGPYTGYSASTIASAPDGTGRLVWVGSDAHIALWNIDATNAYTSQTQFGPYSGWSFQALAVGSDGNARLLWDNVSGQAALWSLTTSGSFALNVQFGPY